MIQIKPRQKHQRKTTGKAKWDSTGNMRPSPWMMHYGQERVVIWFQFQLHKQTASRDYCVALSMTAYSTRAPRVNLKSKQTVSRFAALYMYEGKRARARDLALQARTERSRSIYERQRCMEKTKRDNNASDKSYNVYVENNWNRETKKKRQIDIEKGMEQTETG